MSEVSFEKELVELNDRDITLQQSIKRLMEEELLGSQEMDFFADNPSKPGSASKEESQENHNRLEYLKNFEAENLRQSSEGNFGGDFFRKANSIEFTQKAGQNNTQPTTLDNTELQTATRESRMDEIGAKPLPMNQLSPESSVSSCYNLGQSDRPLGKIKEVSFDHSSARPSFKDPRLEAEFKLEDITFKCLPATFSKVKSNVQNPIITKVSPKPIRLDLEKLKKKYVGQVPKTQSKGFSEIKNISPSKPTENDEVPEPSLEKTQKRAENLMSCKSTSSFGDPSPILMVSRYPANGGRYNSFKDSRSDLFLKKTSSNKKKHKTHDSTSKSCKTDVKVSDISGSFSNFGTFETRGRKSPNLSCHIKRSKSPFENSLPTLKLGTDEYVNVRMKVKEHHQSGAVNLKKKQMRHTIQGRILNFKSKMEDKTKLQMKSNLFRDPILSTSKRTENPMFSLESSTSIQDKSGQAKFSEVPFFKVSIK